MRSDNNKKKKVAEEIAAEAAEVAQEAAKVQEDAAEVVQESAEASQESVTAQDDAGDASQETAEYPEDEQDAEASQEDVSGGQDDELPVLTAQERTGAIESMLFCSGSSLEISKLAECAGCSEEEVLSSLDTLERRYKKAESGLELLRLENAVQLCSKRSYFPVLRRLIGTPRRATLSDTMLETLSIVAYKQPVTRIEIENIRGVSCGHQINRLLEYDLIRELGRLDAPGKPLLFGTTEQFLKSFGVSSIDELPRATPAEIADFQAEAEAEIQEVKV